MAYRPHPGRFRILSDKTFPKWDKDARSGVQKILDECNIKQHSSGKSAYEFGKTKVFIRMPQTVRLLLLETPQARVSH